MKTIKHFLILCAAVVLLVTPLGGGGDGEEKSSVSSSTDESYSASLSGNETSSVPSGDEASSAPSSGDEEPPVPSSKGLDFQLSDDGESYSVTGIGTCTDTDVVIPTTYKGKSVTSIDKKAFEGCTALTSITVPNSVTSIGYATFSGCSSLESMTLPFVGGSASETEEDRSNVLGYIFGGTSYTGGKKRINTMCIVALPLVALASKGLITFTFPRA